MKETIYRCDICNEEFAQVLLEKIHIPIKEVTQDEDGEYWSIVNKDVEVCRICKGKLYRCIRKNFAEIDDCHGIRVKLKYKENKNE